jgi:hypothetical protein
LIISAVLLTASSLSATTIKVLTNHIGYETGGPKRAVVQGSGGDQVGAFMIKDSETDATVYKGEAVLVGAVDSWENWRYWTIDFDAMQAEGTYYIECEVGETRARSFPFRIADDLLESETISDVIYYFKGQRSDGVKDEADRSVGFKGLEGTTIDAHGGWYDASGDYGKHLSHLSFSTWFNPQQLPLVVWSLLTTYDLLDARQDRNFRQYKRRLLDEALFGADYLVRIKRPGGSFYRTVSAPGFEKAPEDRVISPSMRGFKIKKSQRQEGDVLNSTDPSDIDMREYEVGYRAGGGLSIAALAKASTATVSGEFSNADYLAAAEQAFAYLEKSNLLYTNDGMENIVDDYCALLAATELAIATRKKIYKWNADGRATSLLSRLASWNDYHDYWRADNEDRPFFHAADAGMPVVALIRYLEIADDDQQQVVLDQVRKSLEFELSITDEVANPFGYPRQLVQSQDGRRRSSFFFPHDTETEEWWQGENARLASLASAARLASRYYDDDPDFVKKLEIYALNNLNWILGLNPYDACMLHGKGRNNPWYLFFGFYEYTNSPGGICNGITSGLDDERDIDFNLTHAQTGKDHDWRWGEQWLPHAAWYLVAVAAR